MRGILRVFTILVWVGIMAAAERTDALEIAFVLDVSPGMMRHQAFIAEGARLATSELSSADKVAVMTFSSGIRLISGFSDNTREINRAFRSAIRSSIDRPGKRRLYDAVSNALEQFPIAARENTRRAIAIITNDLDNGSTHQPSDLIREANARGIHLWVFLIDNPYPNATTRQNTGVPAIPYPDVHFAADQLRPIAAGTGGEAVIRELNGYVLRQALAACKGDAK